MAWSTVYVLGPTFTGDQPGDDATTYLHGTRAWEQEPIDYTYNLQIGVSVLAPGDLTGDGLEDLVAFDGESDHIFEDYPAWLLPGPLRDRGPVSVDDDAVLDVPAGERATGARCGDVDADGLDDLCLTTGVVFGPVASGATAQVTWDGAGPVDDRRISAADLDADGVREVLLWDAAGHAVRRLTLFPAGDLDLATAASSWIAPSAATVAVLASGGDLDGDGHEDVAVGWSLGDTSRISILSGPDGGDLLGATILDLAADALAMGDLDGDGADDLVVGAPGSVLVFRGPVSGPIDPSSAAVHWTGRSSPEDGFGRSLLAVDLELDGLDELFVGAPDDGYDPAYLAGPGRLYRIPGGSL